MDTSVRVDKIMSQKLITLHPKDKISRAKEIFDEMDIHHIPIVVMNKVVGIVSEGDILFLSKRVNQSSFDEFLRNQKLSIDAVEEIMTKDVICIDKSTSCDDALEIMISRRINALPVLYNNELVGLLTSFDFLKALKKT